MKKFFLTSLLFVTGYLMFSAPVFAAGTIISATPTTSPIVNSCQPIYGGGEVCTQQGNIAINKTVQNPQTGAFVDSLEINDIKFSPEQTVNFRIKITNTGQAMLPMVTVKDILPPFLTFVSGPGNFDQNTKTLTFDISNLNAGESKTFDISAKVVTSDQMSNDKTITCVFNQAIATADSQISQDNVQLCIQKVLPSQVPTTKGGLKVFPPQPVTTTPSTGPEMLSLIALIPAGLAGFILRKRSNSF